MSFNFSAHEQAIQSSIDELLEHQRKTGNEAGILLDSEGKRVGKVAGDDNHIEWNPELLMTAKGGLIIHNHPNSTSLSDVDLMTAGNYGLSIMAVNEDGSRFWATPEGFELEDVVDLGPGIGVVVRFPESEAAFTEVYWEHGAPIAGQRMKMALDKGLPRPEVETAGSHEFIFKIGSSLESSTPWKLNYGWKLGAHAQQSVIDYNRVMDADVPVFKQGEVK